MDMAAINKGLEMCERILEEARGRELLSSQSFSQEFGDIERLDMGQLLLRYVTDETLALMLLEEETDKMWHEFLKFKRKHPESPRVPAMESRFERIKALLMFLSKCSMNTLGYIEEISRLRTCLKEHRTHIKEMEENHKKREEHLLHELSIKETVWPKQ